MEYTRGGAVVPRQTIGLQHIQFIYIYYYVGHIIILCTDRGGAGWERHAKDALVIVAAAARTKYCTTHCRKPVLTQSDRVSSCEI